MGDSPTTDWTKTPIWQLGVSQASSSAAQIAECQKMTLHHQQELLQDAQQRMAAWTKRRQQALETGLDALSRMAACKTPVEMVAICSEWMSGSFGRVLADVEDAQGHTLKMAEQLQQASKSLIDSAQAASRPVNDRQLPVVVPSALREAAE